LHTASWGEPGEPKQKEIPMNVQKIPVHGATQTVGATPMRAIAMPILPVDGAFSISGAIAAVDDASTRSSVVFYPAVLFYPHFDGNVVAGKATENDTGALAEQPQDGSAAQGGAPGAPKLSITGRQVEILLTGLDGMTINWAWALEIILFSLPASAPSPSPQAGTAATTRSGSQAATESGKGSNAATESRGGSNAATKSGGGSHTATKSRGRSHTTKSGGGRHAVSATAKAPGGGT
jgi:hypothetical protein